MSALKAHTIRTVYKFMWIALCVAMGAYLWMLSQIVYDSDLAILTSFAERLLAGQKMSESYFDPNPPLSVLIYVPVILLKNVTGLSIYLANFIYTLLMVGISFCLSGAILKKLELGDRAFHLLLAVFLITQIIVPSQEFGDRDHLVILGLIPFILVQLSLWRDVRLSKALSFTALAFGTVLILLKPHYGLIPSVFLFYRMVAKDGLKILKAPDFLSLAIGVCMYGAILFLYFRDFLEIILPDSIALYTSQRNPDVWKDFVIFGTLLGIFTGFLNTVSVLSEQQKRILNLLALVAFLLFIPYLVQGKALDYHRIPFLCGLFLVLGWGLYALFDSKLKKGWAVFLSVFLILISAYALRGFPLNALTHNEYKTLPLSKALDEHCRAPCRFLMLTDNSENIHLLATYHDAFHASRFTSMWYLPDMIMGRASADKIEKYRTMVGEDLQRMKPDIILVLKELPSYPDFDFVEFYNENETFSRAFGSFEKIDEITFDRSQYFPGMQTSLSGNPPSTFDIYKRK